MKIETNKFVKGIFPKDAKNKEIIKNQIRQEAIKLLKELIKKSNKHWDKLDKYGYTKFPETKNEDAEGFMFKGKYFGCWHEASDITGAQTILEILFDIKEEELK